MWSLAAGVSAGCFGYALVTMLQAAREGRAASELLKAEFFTWRQRLETLPRLLPFADAASADLPLPRLLRLSLFQVSVGLAMALMVGTLNRVMIVELHMAAWLVALMVALPILFPSLLVTFALLFANAFGAIATAYALTGSSLNIVPILLYAQIRGDVLHNPNLGYALAMGMIFITGASNLAYLWFRTRSERWLK